MLFIDIRCSGDEVVVLFADIISKVALIPIPTS